MTDTIVLDCDGEVAAQAATAVLTRRGLQVMRSFDLRTAPGAQGQCLCPDHGPADCTCQYVVLLVYGASGAPAVLAIHGRDARARLQIVQDAYNHPSESLVEQILAALLEAVLELYASPASSSVQPSPR